MTLRQRFMKSIYSLLMRTGRGNEVLKNAARVPRASLYALQATDIEGRAFRFDTLRGKKIMIVNTASDCGYTAQYEALQKLYETYNNKLEIIAFPANDFKEQEKGSNGEIAAFCKLNYGVNFPLMQKSSVVKSDHQNVVFQWLTDENLNGWNNREPTWNFCKYLVNENGLLTHFFGTGVSPFADVVKDAVQ